jgi:hypothetical protein
MSKPQKPTWGYGDPSYAITPSAGKQAVGWLPGEKPPYQYMNWIHLKSGEWLTYLENKTETISPIMVRSNSTLSWNGSTITYTQPIDISFRVTTGEQINRIGVSASPITLLDGQVLVFIKDKTNASPVTLAAGTYGTLIAGQYAILNESTLTAVNQENEVILFRRRGSNLEVPISGQIYPTGSVITLGQSYVGLGALATAGFLPPVGSIIPFYDYNGALTFDTAYWSYCDGSTVTILGTPRQTPDGSGRYLVGFGSDGGGDIDTAGWTTTPVGQAGHIIDLRHGHTVDSHVHTGPNHNHSPGDQRFKVAETVNTGTNRFDFRMSEFTSGATTLAHELVVSSSAGATAFMGPSVDIYNTRDYYTYSSGSLGGTGFGGTGSTGSANPGTDLQLSNAQSIQPRSIRVRYLIRTN